MRCSSLGFTVTPLRYGEIDNLFARIGTGAPHICFAGHTDVVPVGAANWQTDPFAAEVRDGVLYGRGACDMKGGIAAFVAAAAQHLADGPPRGSISLLITGDEEGPAVDGTVRVLEWMAANDQIPDFCIVGEPTCPVKLGDMVKIGRRGSLNAKITVHGTQGHVAYPHRADNPVHRLRARRCGADRRAARCRQRLVRAVQPAVHQPRCRKHGDQRHPRHRECDAEHPVQQRPYRRRAVRLVARRDGPARRTSSIWTSRSAAKSFLTEPGALVNTLRQAIIDASGVEPKLDTGGGTSDARFIARYCPVAEFGLVGATMHHTDERVPVAELRDLARIYRNILAAFLK